MINITIVTKGERERKTIIALLAEQNDFHIVGTGKDAYDALTLVKKHRPDIIIMDFNMDNTTCTDLAPIIRRSSPSTVLVVLCSHNESADLYYALRSGISGCLLREEGYTLLAQTVRSVFYGGLYISKQILDQAMNRFLVQLINEKTKSRALYRNFSATEQQIFYGIINGQSDKEIAKDLNMVTGSLRNNINHIKKETGLRNRTQIITLALLAGIINVNKVLEVFNAQIQNSSI